MTRMFVIFFIFLGMPSFLSSAPDGKKLFEDKCGDCHSLSRSLRKVKDLDGWKRTTIRMIRYDEELLNRKDAVTIAEYLANRNKPDKEASPVNRQPKKKSPQSSLSTRLVQTPEEHGMFEFKKVRVNQFIDPSVCANCHKDKFEQWSGSMHSKAFHDPIWRAATRLFSKKSVRPDEVLEMKTCVKCHTPLGFRSYSITSPKDDFDKLAALPAQGIFCNWCHNINEVKHIGDAGYEVDPGGGEDDPSTMLGPIKDATSDFHPSKYSELHTRSEFCGLCHNVSHTANQLPIEQTYTEWKNSPYNTGKPETTVHCQDCHMRQRPGIPATGKTERPDNPGKVAINGPQRDHVWTHYFIGANALVPRLSGSDVHAKMAVERLQNAADLELIKDSAIRKNELCRISIKVINSGAGHYLPTGLTEIRQMWLAVMVKDARGKIIYQSGSLDPQGNIQKGAVLYNTQLGDAKGEPVLNIARAERILFDHRIPPRGYKIEKFVFQIPADARLPLTFNATLKYRSLSQLLAKELLNEKAPKIPIIDMVSLSEKL
ncbi:multiheme c-type cytochrome [Candidatus Riflebacteria bacterium]